MEELYIDAKTENLDKVLDFVARNLERVKCTVKQQFHVAIAVEEIFVNIAYYAYGPGTGSVILRVAAVNEEEITIEFEDCGKPYNPLEKNDPDITLSVEKRPVGGLGIYMVKHMMDAVEYRRDGDKNILTLRKKLG